MLSNDTPLDLTVRQSSSPQSTIVTKKDDITSSNQEPGEREHEGVLTDESQLNLADVGLQAFLGAKTLFADKDGRINVRGWLRYYQRIQKALIKHIEATSNIKSGQYGNSEKEGKRSTSKQHTPLLQSLMTSLETKPTHPLQEAPCFLEESTMSVGESPHHTPISLGQLARGSQISLGQSLPLGQSMSLGQSLPLDQPLQGTSLVDMIRHHGRPQMKGLLSELQRATDSPASVAGATCETSDMHARPHSAHDRNFVSKRAVAKKRRVGTSESSVQSEVNLASQSVWFRPIAAKPHLATNTETQVTRSTSSPYILCNLPVLTTVPVRPTTAPPSCVYIPLQQPSSSHCESKTTSNQSFSAVSSSSRSVCELTSSTQLSSIASTMSTETQNLTALVDSRNESRTVWSRSGSNPRHWKKTTRDKYNSKQQ